MADSQLSVSIKIVDELSAGLNQIKQNLSGFQQGLSNIGDNLETFGKNLRTVSREVGNLGSVLTLWGAAGVAPFALALKNSSASIDSVGQATGQLSNILKAFQESVAASVVPVIEDFNRKLTGLYEEFINIPKAMRDTILQTILVTSTIALLTGIIIKIGAEIGKVTADIFLLAGRFTLWLSALSPLNVALLLIGVAIASLVIAVGGWDNAMRLLLNTMQLVWESINSGVHASIIAFVGLAEIVVDAEEGIAKALMLLPGVNKQVVQQSITWWDQLRLKLQDTAKNQLPAISTASRNMAQIIQTGTGTWVLSVENGIKTVKDLYAAFQKGSDISVISQATFKDSLIATTSNLGILQAAMQSYSGQSSSMARAAAALGIGLAIVNTAIGVTDRLANKEAFPWPVPAILAAVVAAAGAVQIATIAKQSFAVGTPNVPSDMMAQVHRGETIIPATFADAIRSGQLSLSGGGKSGGGGNTIHVNIYYPKMTNDEEAKRIANMVGFELDKQLMYVSQ